MVGSTFKNPVVAAALVCAVCVYSGFVKIGERHPFASLVPQDDIISMKGAVVSNPVKLSKSNSYALTFEPFSVKSASGAESSCQGRLNVFIDANIVEAHFPGKLYSVAKGKGALVCETGLIAELSGKVGKGGIFFANKASPLGWTSRLAQVRALSRLQFRRLMYAWGDAGGLLLALLSGSREYADKNVSDAFRNAGLSHVLALSGMHLSIVSALALFAGIFAFGKRFAFLFQFFAIAVFVWFAGLSPSLLRAFLCSAFLLVFSLLGIKGVEMFLILCISFLCHALIAPEHLTSAAFMLSYGALAGILLLSETCNNYLSRVVPPRLASPISASVGAQAFTAPISLGLFGTFMPAGIFATVAVSPLITIFIYAGLSLIVLCLAFPALVAVSGFVINAVYSAIRLVVIFFAQFPGIALG